MRLVPGGALPWASGPLRGALFLKIASTPFGRATTHSHTRLTPLPAIAHRHPSLGPRARAAGFVIDRNPFDEVVLRVSLDPALTPRYAEKSAFLRRGGRSDSIAFPLRVDRFPDELIQFTRFAVMGEDEGPLEMADYTKPLSRSNEEAARAAVVDACVAALAGYPRTLEEDRKLLADRGARALLGDRQYAALRLCMNEKAILERAIKAVNALEW